MAYSTNASLNMLRVATAVVSLSVIWDTSLMNVSSITRRSCSVRTELGRHSPAYAFSSWQAHPCVEQALSAKYTGNTSRYAAHMGSVRAMNARTCVSLPISAADIMSNTPHTWFHDGRKSSIEYVACGASSKHFPCIARSIHDVNKGSIALSIRILNAVRPIADLIDP